MFMTENNEIMIYEDKDEIINTNVKIMKEA